MAQPHEFPDFPILEMDPIGHRPTSPQSIPSVPTEARSDLAIDILIYSVIAIATALPIFYYTLFAADRFESVTSFVVRSPTASIVAKLTDTEQKYDVVRSVEDAYIAQAYLKSSEGIALLTRGANLLERYRRPEADWLSTFPSVLYEATEEGLHKYAQTMISVNIDKKTGIAQLRTQAFQPGDARAIAEAAIRAAENRVNEVSARSQDNFFAAASDAVERTRENVIKAQEQIEEFRRARSVIDPTLSSKAETKKFTSIALQAAETQVQIAELEQSAPDSPQLASLQRRLRALQQQSSVERDWPQDVRLNTSAQVGKYEQLMLERILSEKAFQFAQATLELARLEGERQKFYLDVISIPSEPDSPAYPNRILASVVSCLAGLFVFWIARVLRAKFRKAPTARKLDQQRATPMISG